jgi:PAS domain S-box-containing protein
MVAQFPDNRMKMSSSETSRMSAKESKDLSKLTPEEIQVLVYELTIHQAELSTQNEQLKQIQRELEDSRDKYQQLYDSVPVGYLTINDKCFILEANNTAAEMLSTSTPVLKNSRFTSYIAPTSEFQDIFRLQTKRVFQTAEHLDYELEMQNNGAGFFAHIKTVPVFNNQGQVIQLRLAVNDITDRRQAEEALKRSKEQLRKFSIHLQELLESEKKHLAAEIHDELGQMLTALKIELSWLAKRIPPDLEPLSQKAQAMMELINETDKVVKRISSNLRPPILDDLGLNEALRWLCSQFQERTGIKCFLKMPESEICGKEQSTDVFRVIQEALTNVARHSEATTVRITMQNEADNLVITIRDNGKGISKSQIESDKSYGIMGMQERARMLGGELTIKNNNTKGTVVKLVMTAPYNGTGT